MLTRHNQLSERSEAVRQRASEILSVGLHDWQVVNTVSELALIREEWQTLRQLLMVNSPNSDFDRFRASIVGLPNVVPYVAILGGGLEPHGGIMGRLSRRSHRYRIGYASVPGPTLRCLDIVYGGVLASENADTMESVVEHLFGLLGSVIDMIFINHLPAQSKILPRLMAGGGVPDSRDTHWRYRLVPGSLTETIKHLSSKHRSDLRREDRALCRHFADDVELRIYQTPAQVDDCLRTIAGVAERTYQAALGATISDSPLWDSILRCEAEQGRLRSYVLLCQGRAIAFQVGAAYGDVYFPETIGYLPEYQNLSPGRVLHMRVLADLCASGFREYDHGFGDAPYKRVFGSYSWDEVTLLLYSRRLPARMSHAVQRLARGTTHVANRVLTTTQLLSRTKRRWRERMRSQK